MEFEALKFHLTVTFRNSTTCGRFFDLFWHLIINDKTTSLIKTNSLIFLSFTLCTQYTALAPCCGGSNRPRKHTHRQFFNYEISTDKSFLVNIIVKKVKFSELRDHHQSIPPRNLGKKERKLPLLFTQCKCNPTTTTTTIRRFKRQFATEQVSRRNEIES